MAYHNFCMGGFCMFNFLLKNTYLMQSGEDEHTFYLCNKDKRYIFRDGKYCGWYRP